MLAVKKLFGFRPCLGLIQYYFYSLAILNYVVAADDRSMVEKGFYVGCYHEIIDLYKTPIFAGNVKSCLEMCETSYFRYAVLSDDKCACSNELGGIELEKHICNTRCSRNKSEFCGGVDVQSYYDTGVRVSGPPVNLRVLNQSDTTIILRWNEPQQPQQVTTYLIKANVIQSFANYKLLAQPEWILQRTERQAELVKLHPGTVYNISVSAICIKDDCGTAYITGETFIGEPDPPPQEPKIIERTESTITVDILPHINNNGPISYYRLIVMVIDNSLIQTFDQELLTDYKQSIEDGTSYYIAAELDYQNTTRHFIVGDGETYRGYFNAPLQPNSHVHISLGLVSTYKGVTKIRYAIATHDQHNRQKIFSDIDDNQSSIIALSTACVIFGLLLIGSIIAYCYLRFKTGNRLHRLADNHELTLQGPIIDVDNNGYIADDFSKGNFKTQLNSLVECLDQSQKFPRNSIRFNLDDVVARGNFGQVITGTLYANSNAYESQVHIVSDDMETHDQAAFLKDFDQLIRLMPHDKFLNFFGVSITPDWFFIIFEKPQMNLKKRLIEARIPENVDQLRFSSISEECVLQWMYDISVAMEYLEVNKIVHKKLCSYNIYLTPMDQIKVSIFGPTPLSDQSKIIDIERWMPPEVLRFQHYSIKSDIWSFGCISWELCTLGGTLYANITGQDLLARIKNGLRPEQTPFIYNDLYQLLLNCWQLEPSERPDFEEISFNVRQILTSPRHSLSFDRYDNLFIPYYLPLLEIQN